MRRRCAGRRWRGAGAGHVRLVRIPQEARGSGRRGCVQLSRRFTISAISATLASLSLVALGATPASGASSRPVKVTVDSKTAGTSHLAMGVTHTQYSADAWNDPTA